VYIVPLLGGMASIIGACYSVYLFYVGVPKLMGTPAEKVVSYMVVSALVIIALHVIMSAITTGVSWALFATTGAAIMKMN